jgi:hypothetical protein
LLIKNRPKMIVFKILKIIFLKKLCDGSRQKNRDAFMFRLGINKSFDSVE